MLVEVMYDVWIQLVGEVDRYVLLCCNYEFVFGIVWVVLWNCIVFEQVVFVVQWCWFKVLVFFE